MKITKRGIHRNRGQRIVLEGRFFLAEVEGWQDSQKCSKFCMRGSHIFDVEISGQEILLLLEDALLKNVGSDANARGNVRGMLAYAREVLAISTPERI